MRLSATTRTVYLLNRVNPESRVHQLDAPRRLKAPFDARSCTPRTFPLLTERSRCTVVSVTEMNLSRSLRCIVSKPSDLVQGTLDLLLLKILALEPMNGYAISLRLKQVSGRVLQVSDGSLYPALHKLEQEGWICAEWKPTENNRRAKFYSLTSIGRTQLEKESANWNRLSAAISQVIRLEEA